MTRSTSRTVMLALAVALALLGVGAVPAFAAAPLNITKAFGAPSIPLGGSTSLTFDISNTNMLGGASLSGVGFNDSMPPGLVVANPNGLSNCGGTATAVPGSSSVSLSGVSLSASALCVVSVNVVGVSAGVQNNSVTVTSDAGNGNTAMASLTVVAPPTIAAAFGAASIPLGGSTPLAFTLRNPNATTSLSAIAFSDTLPGGLAVSTPNGLTGSCGGGTIGATPGASTLSLSGATLAPGASCTFSVAVTAVAKGVQNDTTGHVGSAEGGTAAPQRRRSRSSTSRRRRPPARARPRARPPAAAPSRSRAPDRPASRSATGS